MRFFSLSVRSLPALLTRPPVQILVGLVILLAAILWPGTPSVTGMALVCLGAMATAVEQFRNSPARGPWLVSQLAIYGSLYLLYLGAALNAQSQNVGGLPPLAAFDLVLSLLPLAAALSITVGTWRDPNAA